MDDWNPFASPLVSPAELHAALSNASPRRIIPVAAGRASHRASYAAHHIPGSIFFDMDVISDTTSPYPQMLPTATHFASCMSKLGIHPDDILVIYDALDVGLYSSPRVAWTCRHFGQRAVHVLNNFPSYKAEGYPVVCGEDLFTPVVVVSSLSATRVYPVQEPRDPDAVIEFEELRDLLLVSPGKEDQDQDQCPYQIIDARIPGRFSGREPEINPALRSGRMPSAVNVPLASILGPDQRVLGAEELRGVFERAGVDETRPAVLTCNSGVTAAALDVALQVSGYGMKRRLYDGSWMEWTRRVGEKLIVVD